MMEIVNPIAHSVGLDPKTAEKAIAMILAFLDKEAEEAPVRKMIASLPGAAELISEYGGDRGGFFSSLMGGGIMGLGQQLMGLGLGMGEITALAKETINVARKYAGEEVVDEVVASVPGLGQFV
ncbi:hypothetical protein JJB09_20720 [Rhizobium sp. KVB221]|uniref:DUF2267 domain-containing protein n=1 Tax=Rhizobium setariae TaxID=2801340 RepID=A0A936YPQ7_9HYPH|nr:hypothetical protein [Rhizobium setariae]MBL0374440.1 hypothetical protein [Rhizobium setariae]